MAKIVIQPRLTSKKDRKISPYYHTRRITDNFIIFQYLRLLKRGKILAL